MEDKIIQNIKDLMHGIKEKPKSSLKGFKKLKAHLKFVNGRLKRQP